MKWQYFKYVMKHKWLVFLASIELGIPFRGLIHDLSKFSLSEWSAYVNKFYPKCKRTGMAHLRTEGAFGQAWAHHFHVNLHHWEAWIIPGKEECLEIPEVFCKEMVADWNAMSRARGKTNCSGWYEGQKEIIKLHPTSRQYIEGLIYAPKG